MDKIPENVNTFLDECANKIGKREADYFSFKAFSSLREVESPIEALFLIAFKYLLYLNKNCLNIEKIYIQDEKHYFKMCGIIPQQKIENYRCDFFVQFQDDYTKKYKKAIVECDSQQWHERTEKERRYEKRRDRILQSKGFKVFRYTGAEIVNSPIGCAREILSYLTEIKEENLNIDSNILDE